VLHTEEEEEPGAKGATLAPGEQAQLWNDHVIISWVIAAGGRPRSEFSLYCKLSESLIPSQSHFHGSIK
jgi:hypothetical protein